MVRKLATWKNFEEGNNLQNTLQPPACLVSIGTRKSGTAHSTQEVVLRHFRSSPQSQCTFYLRVRLSRRRMHFGPLRPPLGGVTTHPLSGSYSSRAAAADLLLRAAMAEPGTWTSIMRWAQRSGNVWGWLLGASGRLFWVFWKGLGRGGSAPNSSGEFSGTLKTDSRNSHPYFHLLVSRWLKCLWPSVVLNFFFHGPWEDHLISIQ